MKPYRHGPLSVTPFDEPMFGENAYLVALESERLAWVIDPGLPPQPKRIADALTDGELKLVGILLTHCHADHLAGVPDLQRKHPGVPLHAPRGEEHMLGDPTANLSALFGMPVSVGPAARIIGPGDSLALGETQWQVLDVSGHSPGGLAFYCPAAAVVFTGDALIPGSMGRYDFPGSSGPRLIANMRRHLLTLPDETAVYSGHGPPSTIGKERSTNPCLQEDFVP